MCYINMHQNLIQDVFESLENFILLKQQNLIIYFWMTFKKNHKKTSLNHSRVSSKSFSIKSSKDERSSISFNRSNSYINNELQNQGRKKMVIQNKRFPTQYHNKRQDQIAYKFKKPDYTYKPGFRYKQGDGRGKMYYSNQIQQLQLDNSDEFQDIVLDRLSKLQQNINKLMRTRKAQELPSHKEQDYNHPIILNDLRGNYQQRPGIRDEDIKERDIKERKIKFFDSLQKAGHQKLDRNDMIFNVKYIPSVKKVQNMRSRTQGRELDEDEDVIEQDLIEDIQFFNQNHLRKTQRSIPQKVQDRQLPPNQLGTQNSNPSNQTHFIQIDSKNKGTSVLYMDRYRIPQTTKHNRIHYIPHDIEMKTVFESRKKYNRNNNNMKQMGKGRLFSKMNNVSYEGAQQESKQPSFNNSEVEYISRKNNLTTYN